MFLHDVLTQYCSATFLQHVPTFVLSLCSWTMLLYTMFLHHVPTYTMLLHDVPTRFSYPMFLHHVPTRCSYTMLLQDNHTRWVPGEWWSSPWPPCLNNRVYYSASWNMQDLWHFTEGDIFPCDLTIDSRLTFAPVSILCRTDRCIAVVRTYLVAWRH